MADQIPRFVRQNYSKALQIQDPTTGEKVTPPVTQKTADHSKHAGPAGPINPKTSKLLLPRKLIEVDSQNKMFWIIETPTERGPQIFMANTYCCNRSPTQEKPEPSIPNPLFKIYHIRYLQWRA